MGITLNIGYRGKVVISAKKAADSRMAICGREYGLTYTENEEGGVMAHILLPLKEETK